MLYYDVQEEKNINVLQENKSDSTGFLRFKFFDYGDVELFNIFISKLSGLLYVDTKGNIIEPSALQSAIEMVSNEVKKWNITPQINISKKNGFLEAIASACHFKKIPTLGKFKFTIWKYCDCGG